MSNALSIAAVTATLRNLIDLELNADVAGTQVTTRPPAAARDGATGNQVNLFLYHVAVNPAWRNADLPWRVRPGEVAPTPLPLNLYYLLTAYSGENDDDIDSTTDPNRLLGGHRLLGQAMRALHDHPVLHAEEIAAVLPPDDLLDYPYDQVENVRITPQPLSLDEVAKIWAGFQTGYRLSMSYEVSVVLIESRRARRAALPVLRRGPDDRGATIDLGPYPALTEIRRPPRARPGYQLGDRIELHGVNLLGEAVAVRFVHGDGDELTLAPLPGSTDTRLLLDLPDDAPAQTAWAPGFYAVTVEAGPVGRPPRGSNSLPLALSPRVTSVIFAAPNVTVVARPQIRPDQRARLLLGEAELPAAPHPAATDTLTFDASGVPAADYVARLRVDGVDSLPAVLSAAGLEFDPAQRVTIP